jgi:2-dehydropantoate 2-reductase
MPPMIIGIVGAGGIGGYYAGLLSRAGHPVRLLARGDHLAAIQRRGLEVRTPDETFITHPEATDDGTRLVGCDYVFVTVKGYSLPEVGAEVAAAAKAGAAIVPLLNGIDVPDRLVALGVPRDAIIGGFVRASLVRTEPGVISRLSPFDVIVIGELDRVERERTSRLANVFTGANINASVSDDIVLDLWRKFAFIVTMGVACGLSRKSIGPVLSTERGRALVLGAIHEIVEVSQGALGPQDEEQTRKDIFALPAAMKPSFLLDLERGGPTELELLPGTVSRFGRERGVPTPIHDVATAAFEIATL